ncbi:hypothetical protein I8751_11635 [Nostocaceae cyanobacterium CENA357]|uniref:Secreted protein n=1 Tax=Atlanticothrix silvestris CENA357 TaxID=1725252 RepID=A0A8J7HH81_9CYAN|nr:hypothetical protein [Atlanticothrix silvestris]MBH8553005.1 hypothetical protein [Atlanticothrix silvestris CENA357]
MRTHFRITSAMIFCVSAYITIPKIAGATVNFSTLTADILSISSSDHSTRSSIDSQDSRDTFIPPNHGGPDSLHGSGTR